MRIDDEFGGEEIDVSGRIAVISDIHGNIAALNAVIADIDVHGVDHMVIAGDLLTYGCDCELILEKIDNLISVRKATLLEGNHDHLYLADRNSDKQMVSQLPEWIRESVEWTRDRIAGFPLYLLPWQTGYVCESALIAHANPFGFGDWSYLNDPPALARAVDVLAGQGFRLGVFGHTHRPRLAWKRTDTSIQVAGNSRFFTVGELGMTQAIVVDTGAVGQPRDGRLMASYGLLEWIAAGVRVELRSVAFDVAAHLARIRSVSLSLPTKERLCSYFPDSSC